MKIVLLLPAGRKKHRSVVSVTVLITYCALGPNCFENLKICDNVTPQYPNILVILVEL